VPRLRGDVNVSRSVPTLIQLGRSQQRQTRERLRDERLHRENAVCRPSRLERRAAAWVRVVEVHDNPRERAVLEALTTDGPP
jgi:hypothetical protein